MRKPRPNPRPNLAAIAVLAAAALAGCGLTSPTGAASGASAGTVVDPIGYSALFLQDPAQSAMVRIFESEAQRRGLQTLSPTSANSDASKQDADIRNLVNAGAKSLFVVPADPQAVVPAIRYATERGVRVVTLMLGPSGGPTTVSMQVDNTQIGERACRYLGAKLAGTGTVLQVQGDMRSTNAQRRQEGFDACMSANYPDIAVLTKTGGRWDPAKAAESAAGALSTDPDIRGIFLHSDGYQPSVHQVLEQRGRATAPDAPDHVWTVSVDGTPAALDAIRAGDLDASVSQPADQFVLEGLEYLQALADQREIAVGPTPHGSTVELTGDGYPADLFPPLVVDAANVDDAALWANQAR